MRPKVSLSLDRCLYGKMRVERWSRSQNGRVSGATGSAEPLGKVLSRMAGIRPDSTSHVWTGEICGASGSSLHFLERWSEASSLVSKVPPDLAKNENQRNTFTVTRPQKTTHPLLDFHSPDDGSSFQRASWVVVLPFRLSIS